MYISNILYINLIPEGMDFLIKLKFYFFVLEDLPKGFNMQEQEIKAFFRP